MPSADSGDCYLQHRKRTIPNQPLVSTTMPRQRPGFRGEWILSDWTLSWQGCVLCFCGAGVSERQDREEVMPSMARPFKHNTLSQ
jgi:hypothetical protein